MHKRNQAFIDAIIAKAHRDCPGSLAMIGIYGSFLTGDIHEKSDLDLMILINDENGYCLAHTFLLEDEGIGHDLYCTTWEALENDAKFTHPHIAKLMDSQIVYCADESYRIRLEALRKQALDADTQKAAEDALKEAESAFAKAILAEDIAICRAMAGEVLYRLTAAIALLNKRYFRLGTRRLFDEIDAMERKPADFQQLLQSVVAAETTQSLKKALIDLLRKTEALFEAPQPESKAYPGTYEEMFSNWRNKMYLAAQQDNTYLSFDCLGNLDFMLKDLGFHWNIMDQFDPNDLWATAKNFDTVLERYLEEYRKEGILPRCYPNAEAFATEYMKKEGLN